jgi:hypothetical protein
MTAATAKLGDSSENRVNSQHRGEKTRMIARLQRRFSPKARNLLAKKTAIAVTVATTSGKPTGMRQ